MNSVTHVGVMAGMMAVPSLSVCCVPISVHILNQMRGKKEGKWEEEEGEWV